MGGREKVGRERKMENRREMIKTIKDQFRRSNINLKEF